MAERRWVGPASVIVLVLLVASTVAAVLVSQRQLDDRLRSLAESAAGTVRQDVQLNLQREAGALLAEVGTPNDGAGSAVEVFAEVGRIFRLEVTLPATALGTGERRVPLLVGALGMAISLGLLLTSAAWRRTAQRADRLAARRTAALASTTAELEVANRELRELDRLRDRMIGTVSHDLRSPLTVIRGAAQVLLDRPLSDEDRRELIRRLLRQTSRLRGLIDELLVSAQARAGALRADRRPLDLLPLVATVIDDLGFGDLDPSSDEIPPVMADQVHVERILHNLLMNAVKHGAPPVEVALRAVGSRVEVHVRDRGRGVPVELREQVFTDFGRADGAGPGYGLGLAIATELARVNEGTLTYREREEPGACFVLTLPVA